MPSVSWGQPASVWQQLTNAPPSRVMPALAYDSRRGRMLMMAGCASGEEVPRDLWALTLDAPSQWTRLTYASQNPWFLDCDAVGMVYDAATDRVVLFHQAYGDTMRAFAYDLTAAGGWTELGTTGARPVSLSSYPTFFVDPDARQVIMVAHEVWTLSLSDAGQWTQLFPGGEAPVPTFGTATAFDTRRHRILLNGGTSGLSLISGSTWALELGATPYWFELATPPPFPPRTEHGAVYDPVHDRFVIAGGNSLTHSDFDAWALDLGGGTGWHRILAPSPANEGRHLVSALYDPLHAEMVIQGGSDFTNVLSQTLRVSLEHADSSRVEPPIAEPTIDASMVYDSDEDRVLLFGGQGPSRNHSSHLYELRPHAAFPGWSRLTWDGAGPAGRASLAAVWDPARHRMILFGGRVGGSPSSELGDLWAYTPGALPRWSQLSVVGPAPAPRGEAALAYDPVRDRLLLYGGAAGRVVTGQYHQWFADFWELPLGTPGGLTWRMLVPGGQAPGIRARSRLVYDPARDQFVLVGGMGPGANQGTDVYEWIPTPGDGAWQIRPGSFSWNNTDQSGAFLRGGDLVSFPFNYEAASLPLVGTAGWTKISRSSEYPRNFLNTAVAYVPTMDRMVMFGGLEPADFPNSVTTSDTWQLVWLGPVNLGVPIAPVASRATLRSASPQPAHGSISFEYSLQGSAAGRLELFDLAGRHVASVVVAASPEIRTTSVPVGGSLSAGVYFARLNGPAGRADCRLVLAP